MLNIFEGLDIFGLMKISLVWDLVILEESFLMVKPIDIYWFVYLDIKFFTTLKFAHLRVDYKLLMAILSIANLNT